jgi:type IV pilus assembly protein PilA
VLASRIREAGRQVGESKLRKRIHKGFTLIELMLAVAIIGVLVAVAIPIYQDFTIRTRVAELVAAMGPLKSSVAEKAHQDASLDNAGVGVTVAIGGKVTGGSVTDAGVITISGNAAALGTAVTIVLTPSLAPRGTVVWMCSTAPETFKYVPSECRH